MAIAAQRGNELGKALCAAWGIDADHVTEITIFIRPQTVATAMVKRLIVSDDGTEEILTAHTLTDAREAGSGPA
jgi:hypothetical protein